MQSLVDEWSIAKREKRKNNGFLRIMRLEQVMDVMRRIGRKWLIQILSTDESYWMSKVINIEVEEDIDEDERE